MNRTFQEQEYRARINRVIDHIQQNLDKKLTMGALANVACFSPFHFHRIFRAIMGETLTSFIQRLRIEKAASMLVNNPKKSITEMAFDVGFSGPASFARLFKEFFGVSASQWRKSKNTEIGKIRTTESKNGKTNSKSGKERVFSSGYFIQGMEKGGAASSGKNTHYKIGRRKPNMSIAKNTNVIVEDLSTITVAYVRNVGPYKGNEKLFETLWARLMMWAGPRGLMQQPNMSCLSIYHDDPDVTDEKNLRVSVCISVPPDTVVDADIGKMELAGGKCAVARFEIDGDQFQDAWNFVYGEWLPKSGYQCDDRPCFERYMNDPKKHPQKKHIVDICVPVRPF
jgi:AraC family transcriptional regulator